MRPRRSLLFIALPHVLGCVHEPVPIEVPCAPGLPAPYPAGSSYGGVHANRENNDIVACETGTAFVERWHALEGLAMSQPNTFSPDGRTTYAATFNPDPAGCNVHAIDVATGETVWCRTFPRSVGGTAIEVDSDGALYFTADRFVYSLNADGSDRWRTAVGAEPMGEGFGESALGVHFTVDGHAATVTNQGVVVLLDRADGRELARLDIALETGFVPPESITGMTNLRDLLPDAVNADFDAVFGTMVDGGLGAFLGAGGGFSDNTIAVSSRDELFVIGGGEDPQHGALVQIRIGGSAAAPTLALGWALHTVAGSATSPSVTFDGRWVSVGDGQNAAALLSPARAMGRMLVADVDACDANTDADADPMRCAPMWEHALERGPIAGSPPILPDGTIAFWEISVSQGVFDDDARDLAIVGPDGPIWESTLPDGLDWTSVITVTNNHLVGTASIITPSTTRALTVRLPERVESFLAVVDRRNGALVFRAPVTDDSTATVTVGPDGSLYVGMFGLLTILATEQSPVLGLVRFSPTAR
jgi:hypothetical protein